MRKIIIVLLLCCLAFSGSGWVAGGGNPVYAATTVYEAEDGTLGGSPLPQINSDHPGYSGTGFVAYFNQDGQFFTITANVATAGIYKVIMRYASDYGAVRSILVNGSAQFGAISFPAPGNGGSWDAWADSEPVYVHLNAGSNTITVKHDSAKGSTGSANFDYFKIEETGEPYAPYNGTSVSLPGTVQAEDYNTGGSGIAYSDTTSGNTGGTYRTDDVDIQTTSDSGNGYNVAWTDDGEWLKYNVRTDTTANFNMDIRVANAFEANAAVKVYIDGQYKGKFAVPVTGDYQTWTTIQGPRGIRLHAGVHAVKLEIVTGNFNVNWMEFTTFGSRLEAEEGTLGGSPRPQINGDHSGYTGTGFVSYFESDTQYVQVQANVPADDYYAVTLRYSAAFSAGKIYRTIELNDKPLYERFEFAPTASWDSWRTLTFITKLQAGANKITVRYNKENESRGTVNLDHILVATPDFSSVSYTGASFAPGRVEAEHYDIGGEGDAYHDTTASNLGGAARPDEAVDLSANDEGGHTVSSIEAGEWLKYKVVALASGTYNLKLRTSAVYDNQQIRIFIDEVDYGSYTVPNTGSYSEYREFTIPAGIELTQGTHVVKLYSADANSWGAYNLDWFQFDSFRTGQQAESGTLGGSPAPVANADHPGYRGTGFVASFLSDGQYVRNTVNVPTAGVYRISYRYSADQSASRNLAVNGISVADNLTFPSTINWSSWSTAAFEADLNAGENVIEVKYNASLGSLQALNLDEMTVEFLNGGNAPYNGPHTVPGTIEAEDYDAGGPGVAYADTTASNEGGVYRTGATEGVDVQASPDGGYEIYNIANGEWVKYTVQVAETGNYDVRVRVQSPDGGDKIRVYIDDVDAGIVPLGSLNAYSTISLLSKKLLTKGTHEVTLKFVTSGTALRLNWLKLEPSFAIVPGIQTPSLATEDVIVSTVAVTDYGVVPNGNADATSAFQNALDTVGAMGGGVVFVPAGTYRIDGTLSIPQSVTLRGEWLSPDDGGLGVGTILKAYSGKDKENGTPFITMNRSTSVRNLSIWYPEQDYNNVHAYPFTIAGGEKQDTISVMNVTLYNSYKGIQLGQNGYANGVNVFRNLYATILKAGVIQDNTFDVARNENVYFKADYWIHSGLAGAPSSSAAQSALKAYMAANAVGFEFRRVDWIYMHNINIRDMKTGIYTNGNCNGQIYGLNIDDVNVGLHFERLYIPGFEITNSTINATKGSRPIGILYNADSDNIVQLNHVAIGGTPYAGIQVNGNSVLNLTDVTFTDWGYNGGTYAIEMQKGSVLVESSKFQQAKKAISLSAAVTAAAILGNTFVGAPQIDNASGGDVKIDHTALATYPLPNWSYSYAPERQPAVGTNFYNVKSAPYQAAGDGTSDDTNAIQSALTDAGNAGGGTVYLPAGDYRVSTHLQVPAGVELRGSFDNPHHGMVMNGTVLLAYENQGNEAGTAFITLAQNSGVRGLTIFYPEQDFTDIQAYPWTIQAQGDGSWVKYLAFVNSYKAIDMDTHSPDQYQVVLNNGTTLREGLRVGKGSALDLGGWVEDNHWNPTNWLFTSYNGTPSADSDTLFEDLLASSTGFVIGSANNAQVFQNFTILNHVGMNLIGQTEGNCRNCVVFSNGVDASKYGVVIDSSDDIVFINPQTATELSDFVTSSTFSGTLKVFNGGKWSTHPIATLNGGTTIFQTFDMTTAYPITVNGGTFYGYGMVFHTPGVPHVVAGPHVTSVVLKGNTGKGGFTVTNQAGTKLVNGNNTGY